MSVTGWSGEVTGWSGETPTPTSLTVTVAKVGKPVPWMMYTVSPSPNGWLTHSSGVLPGWRGEHGGDDATGAGSVTPFVLLAVLLLAVLLGVVLPLAVFRGVPPAA